MFWRARPRTVTHLQEPTRQTCPGTAQPVSGPVKFRYPRSRLAPVVVLHTGAGFGRRLIRGWWPLALAERAVLTAAIVLDGMDSEHFPASGDLDRALDDHDLDLAPPMRCPGAVARPCERDAARRVGLARDDLPSAG